MTRHDLGGVLVHQPANRRDDAGLPEYASTVLSVIRCVLSLSCEPFEPLDQRPRAACVAGDRQNRVVAGDRADDFRKPRAVDRHAEQLRLSRPGAQQHQLLHAIDARQIVGERAMQQRLRRVAVAARLRGRLVGRARRRP